jgi:hypothetical protein
MMNLKLHPRESRGDEKGMVLVLGLLLVSVLSLVGTTAVMTSSTDIKINSNYNSGAQAFYIAEAGIERARARLTTEGSTLSQLLNARKGSNNQLTDSTFNSTFMARFFNSANRTFVTDDSPYIAQTSFGGGTYRVYLTNDANEPGGVTSMTDTNSLVTLTSFGQGPNNSLAVVQAVVKKLTLPTLPGGIVLPGPGISFQGGLSTNSSFDGKSASVIALTSDAARNSVTSNLTAPTNRLSQYGCDHSPCINNVAATIDPTLNSVSGLEGLYRELMSVANTVTGTTTGATATTTTLTNTQLGTDNDRRIVVVNGNAIIDNIWNDGAGILVVTGQLTLRNNSDYRGLILCIGQGSVVADGWNNGSIKGVLLVAKTRDASNNLLTTLGNPTYNLSNDFQTDVRYSASEVNSVDMRFIKKSWRKLF